ncbi:Zinc finger protein NUTCRACKER [Apostasia shenzhenica]|uniref:Protein EARLY HEADING DATE 2 n=1 Tax=Apostasia shenzhenica TaxID=1088818 RepID=A0A2I0ADL1_9ASPA|nr:Zinc finger protein NUTCRACKER [Apostasia shenzhenica]
MPVELVRPSVMAVSNSASGDASVSSGLEPLAAVAAPPPKKKRNLPGMPDPDAEVIALSPRTLLATNRFVCEICNKGFQRDQNLQLHRRGHNLPWKLRQRTGKEVRKRVYVCPEPNCVHHDPSRALGDLTGIKKHFCRKHGEKKWKCDKCSKKYAVQSDWKAHSKTCGTREYRCDCGTLFSRRDSFITHRAFCDALAEESAKSQTVGPTPDPANSRDNKETKAALPVALPDQQMVLPQPHLQPQREPQKDAGIFPYVPPALPPTPPSISVSSSNSSGTTASGGSSNSGSTAATSIFASLFASCGSAAAATRGSSFSDLIGAMSRTDRGAAAIEIPSLCLSSNSAASLLPLPPDRRQYAPAPPSAQLSATALLQKAAQMGATASGSSFLRGFGLSTSSSSPGAGDLPWRQDEPALLSAGLGLGLPYDTGAGAAAAHGGGGVLPDIMMGSSPLFGSKPATLDFLGLGMGPAGSATAGSFSALITSIGGGVDAYPGAPAGTYGGQHSPPAKAWDFPDRKSSSRALM